jgi:hypothetical protein
LEDGVQQANPVAVLLLVSGTFLAVYMWSGQSIECYGADGTADGGVATVEMCRSCEILI